MDTHFVDVDGHRIRCVDRGQGEPIILVHGITGYIEDWNRNIDALAADYRVLALDLIGSGLSDKPENFAYTQENIARSILSFMDVLGVERAHLGGYSSGARQALMAAAMAPERVLSVVALAPAGFGPKPIINFRLASVPGLGEVLTKPSRLSTKMLMKTAVYDPAVLSDDLLDRKSAMARVDRAQPIFLRTLRGFVGFTGFQPAALKEAWDTLAKITCPVLLIWGQNDKFVSVDHAQAVQDGLSDVTYLPYENCGHLPQIEHADRLNADVLSFLAKQGRA